MLADEDFKDEGVDWGQQAPPKPPPEHIEVEVPVGGYVETDHICVQTEVPCGQCWLCNSTTSESIFLCTTCTPVSDEEMGRPSLEKTRIDNSTQTDPVPTVVLNGIDTY